MKQPKNSILFVDDEPNVLSGLKRSLRSNSSRWDMFFVSSGQDALRKAQEQHFDAVVSDMRMPGMDGAELLDTFSKKHPDMIRFILSGHSDDKLIIKSAKSTHQFMSKPCSKEELESTLSRAFALKSILKEEQLQRLVTKITSLPTLPKLYIELTELLQSEKTTVKNIGKLISNDPSMVAKFLQLVNSSFFGIGHHISNPEQAVTLLGLDTVKSLVLSAGVFSQFNSDQLGIQGGFSLQALYDHCIQVGNLAKEIALSENAPKEVVENSLLAGLLHDIGKVILAQNMHKEFQHYYNLIAEQGHDSIKEEINIFRSDHGKVGGYLMGLWALPTPLIEAVAYHHDPMKHPIQKGISPLAAVHVANAFVSSGSNDASVLPAALDLTYIEEIGLSDRTAKWEALANQAKDN